MAKEAPAQPVTEEIRYKLRRPFEYASGGQTAQADHILLTAPTGRNSRECAFLKQAFFRAVPKTDKPQEAPKDAKPPTGQEVMTLIAVSKDVELADVIDVARRLLTSGVAMVDGEVKLTGPLIDKMDEDDLEAMVGEYLVGFTLASSLARN